MHYFCAEQKLGEPWTDLSIRLPADRFDPTEGSNGMSLADCDSEPPVGFF